MREPDLDATFAAKAAALILAIEVPLLLLFVLLMPGCSLHLGAASLGVDVLRTQQRTQVASGGAAVTREGKAAVRGVELLEAAPGAFWDLLTQIIGGAVPGAPETRDAWLAEAACDEALAAQLLTLLGLYEERMRAGLRPSKGGGDVP